ncbi:MAG: hypothetical protein GY792_35170 [Gammaproteobacteria bacterium]|nr:hypothetical protein [Gammaproteobacteria bacterium]
MVSNDHSRETTPLTECRIQAQTRLSDPEDVPITTHLKPCMGWFLKFYDALNQINPTPPGGHVALEIDWDQDAKLVSIPADRKHKRDKLNPIIKTFSARRQVSFFRKLDLFERGPRPISGKLIDVIKAFHLSVATRQKILVGLSVGSAHGDIGKTQTGL